MPVPIPRAFTRFSWMNTIAIRPIILSSNIHTTQPRFIKDSMKDRTKIDVGSNEYTKSGSDPDAASKDTAFDPNESNPQEEMHSKEKSQGDTLNVSPGNTDISKPVGNKQGGAENSSAASSGQQKSSGSGSPAKGKKL